MRGWHEEDIFVHFTVIYGVIDSDKYGLGSMHPERAAALCPVSGMYVQRNIFTFLYLCAKHSDVQQI